jgi:hypothetical protein
MEQDGERRGGIATSRGCDRIAVDNNNEAMGRDAVECDDVVGEQTTSRKS